MRDQIRILREQLARQLSVHGPHDPRVEHLRWQIASLERQDRWADAPAMPGMAGHRVPIAGRDGPR